MGKTKVPLEQLRAVYTKDKTRQQMAFELNVSCQTISRYCKKLNLPLDRSYDLTDKKYGILTARKPTHQDKRYRWYWLCDCDCGNTVHIAASSLIDGTRTHCGCLNNIRRGKEHQNWTGFEEIPGKFFSDLRCSAAARDLEFTITIEFLWDLFIKQDRKCKYTGEELKFGPSGKAAETNASVDRIDSSIGYVPDNVQLIHKEVNLMKHILSEERFLYLCHQITNNMNN